VRTTALSAYDNQHVPFEKLVELQPHRSLEYNPIFQVMFVLQNGKTFRPNLDGLTVKRFEAVTDTSKFDLSLEAIDGDDGLDLSISYSTDLFKAESAMRILADYQTLLRQFVANPEQRVDAMPELTWTPQCLPAQAMPVSSAGIEFVPPGSPIEEKLVSIWKEVLLIDTVGVHDNFFALGGHSLMATQAIARIRSAFDFELPLRKLFEAPTISALANVIYENQAGKTEEDELAALLAELEGLSDDEARLQFTQENAT